jgi:2-desacetyl-2-hydroxyethyl bacteriochlorophyllide A dehydrogenase
MKTLRISEPGKIVIEDHVSPIAHSGEVLIKIKYVGFCGSDLSTYLGRNPMVQYPRVPGHEISAEVFEVGANVPDSFKTGDKVTVVPYTSCGQCPACRRGRENACQFNQTLGVQRDGAMQEYISVPWQKVLKAPLLNDLELAMIEPLTVGFHAIDRGRISDSDVVMVLGCGMIGAGAIARGSLRGATIIAVDIDDQKLDLARELGASYVINSSQSNLHDELLKLTSGAGPDVVVEAVGNPLTYKAAVDEVAFTGRVVCIGYTAKEVEFATKFFVQKEIDILGSRNATSSDFMAVISYLERGTFPLNKMISSKVKPEEAAEAVKKWSEDPGKVMKILLNLNN